MSSAVEGRFCNACDKIVIDFTKMTDEQLVSFFANYNAGEHPCGRFREDQLNKTIAVPKLFKKFEFLKLAASVLLAQALFYNGKAFGKIMPQIDIVSQIDAHSDEYVRLTGSVMDFHSNKPISGLKVYIDSTELNAITDNNGKFTILIPKAMNGALTLLTEYVNKENYVAGSIILAKKGEIEELSQSEIILYRYPEEHLDELHIIEYKMPLISGGYTLGAPETVVIEKKESFWHKITNLFRKK